MTDDAKRAAAPPPSKRSDHRRMTRSDSPMPEMMEWGGNNSAMHKTSSMVSSLLSVKEDSDVDETTYAGSERRSEQVSERSAPLKAKSPAQDSVWDASNWMVTDEDAVRDIAVPTRLV
mmetsp:Transcript_891/g.2844  ORF Transcript_891/g.2844 Transcript_891/m.2844 type:complete len:118 (-) Transcript_891:140-493(-)